MVLSTLAIALAACGGGIEVSPAAQAVAAADVLARSAEAMAEVSSFRFALEIRGGGTPIPGGLEMTMAEGVMEKPDRMKVTVKATLSGLVVEVRAIGVGEEAFMTNPLTGAWQSFGNAASPLAFFDPARGAGLVLSSVTHATVSEGESTQGRDAYLVRGRLPASAVGFMTGSHVEGSILDARLWITKDDFLLRRVEMDGLIVPDEVPGLVRILTLSDFGEAFDIEPPS